MIKYLCDSAFQSDDSVRLLAPQEAGALLVLLITVTPSREHSAWNRVGSKYLLNPSIDE